MGNALVKASAFTIQKEATYGTDPGDGSNPGDLQDLLIECSGTPEFTDSFETVERNIIRQSFSSYAPLRGVENTSGSFAIEAHGSGLYDTELETALAYKAAFGYLIGPNTVTGAVDAVVKTTIATEGCAAVADHDYYDDPQMYKHVLSVTDASDFEVGYPIRVLDASDQTVLHLAGFVESISAGSPDEITVISARPDDLSGVIDPTDLVDCGYLFKLCDEDGDQVNSLISLTLKYWRGDITKEVFVGDLITEFGLDLSTGQLIVPSFSWEGKTVSYATETFATSNDQPNGGTYDSENTSPLIAKLTDVFMEERDTPANVFQSCISNLQISLTNEVFKKQCLATEGIGEVIRTGRSVTGSLETFYEDKSFQDAPFFWYPY